MPASKLVRVASEENVPDGCASMVSLSGKTLAIFRIEGVCYATDNACPHRGGQLAKGQLSGHVVTCPWHGWTWDVRTGANTRNPAVKPLTCYPVTELNGAIFVELAVP